MELVSLSENTVMVLFEQRIDRDNFSQVTQLTQKIRTAIPELIVDIIPAYASIHITFKLLTISHQEFCRRLQNIIEDVGQDKTLETTKKIIEIPVYYGEEVALDLLDIAAHAKLSPMEVIDKYASAIYDVYAIGFAPGFAYLGNVDQAIAMPRKATPRQQVPKGSVAIADQQTAIYPSQSPGGWQVIGCTPVSIVDFESDNLTLFSVGDQVRFKPISKEQYLLLGGVL